LVERNLGGFASIIQTKFAAGEYADYTDSLGVTSGNDKLIVVDRAGSSATDSKSSRRRVASPAPYFGG
jgi:hypothetical protein